MEEAKVEERLLDNWGEVVRLLFELRERWSKHLEFVQIMNIDYVNAKLQSYLANGFNRADFYLAIPDLIDYARQLGGIEYLQIIKEKPKYGRK